MTLVKESIPNMREIKTLPVEGSDPQGFDSKGKELL